MRNNATRVAIIVLVSLGLFVFVAPNWANRGLDAVGSLAKYDIPDVPAYPFHLGLDLVGGVHLVYEADLSDLQGIESGDAMEGVRDVIERRVDFFGVSEPVIQISGENRLIVDLAGITDVDEAIRLIGETPFLEFREQSGEEPQEPEYTVDESGQVVIDEASFLAGWAPTGLSGKHVRRARLEFDPQTGVPQVGLELNEEGAQLFAQITARNLGRPVAIFLDGFPISIPTVQSEITDGNAVITGQFTPTEAKQLVTRLNSGALPVPISIISQQTVGASLGHASLTQSLKAGLWGLLLVALFMLVYYRVPGLTAVLALGVYVLIVLAIFKLLPVTLTLAGIAGFVLSMGIAVDANVLVFARMREELRAGHALPVAVHEGFRRAWLSIRDSHVTTLLGAFVLYAFTTSVVKGFALTLGIGVLTSLLTATVITRAFLNMFVRPSLERKKWLF
ncbi:MAG TPA: protein translocase subunit SecD [Candidatus Paceibacterota bacterium]|nr:protein translocase subunit SecD [Candidatus Paceibacterota bacterium]